MPQKRMAARGQSSKLAKGPSPKKATVAKSVLAKPAKAEKPVKKAKVQIAPAPAAAKSKVSAKISGPNTVTSHQDKAKAALKKEAASSAVAAKSADSAKPAKAKAPKSEKRGRKINIDIVPGEGATALSGKWATLYKKADQIEAQAYNMRNPFEEKTAIVHKVLGWGYILANRNDRLEVLFKDGIKYLISNYKP